MRVVAIAVAVASSIAAGGLCACSGGRNTLPQWQLHQQKSNEITALWTQIRQWRSEAKMDLDPPAQLLQMTRGKSVREAARSCPADHAVPTVCNDVCSLAENICDNAERICTLADELGKGDDFAQQKCTSAKASCREAKQRCCGCSDDAPRTGSLDPQSAGTW